MAALLAFALAVAGCATASSGSGAAVSAAPATNGTLLAEYVQGLPIGARVRADLTDGRRLRGTLMRVTRQSLVIQPHTRLPEPPLDVPLAAVWSVELEAPSSLGRSVAIGLAAGAGGAIGVLLVLAAALAGD
jgi:hypothetical protein